MGLNKSIEAEKGCWARALDDEPVFVLLARDPEAPSLVRRWADRRMDEISHGTRPASDEVQVWEARDWALAAEKWREEANFKWREVK